MRLLHWMGEGEERRYRVWSTVSDTYYGEPMTEAELRASGLVVLTDEPMEIQLARWQHFSNGELITAWWAEPALADLE